MTVNTEAPASVPFYRRAWFWGCLIMLLVIAALLCAVAQSHDPSEQMQKLATSELTGAPGKEQGVVAKAWIEPVGNPASARHYRLWVLLENHSSSAVVGLRFLDFQTPGFRAVDPRACWAAGVPVCRPQGPGEPFLVGLPKRIDKGGAVAVFALLEPIGEIAQSSASGVYEWRDEHGTVSQSALVMPGVPVVPLHERLWIVLAKALLFLKDLLLPAAVAFLGWYLQRRDQDRQEKTKEEDRKREQTEKNQARISDTWNLMLPKSHKYARKHYMPVAGAIDELLRAHIKAVPPNRSDDVLRRLLWSLLWIQRQMRWLVESIGGLYFRNREGERLAGECWNEFILCTRDQLGVAENSLAVDIVTLDDSLPSFLDKLAGPAPGATESDPNAKRNREVLEGQLTRLKAWVDDRGMDRNLPLIELFLYILAYESNRPYELWYEGPAEIEREKFWIALERLELRQESLKGRLEKYLQSIPAPTIDSQREG